VPIAAQATAGLRPDHDAGAADDAPVGGLRGVRARSDPRTELQRACDTPTRHGVGFSEQMAHRWSGNELPFWSACM